MSKEKNKNTFRIGALLLVACLISSVMLSGTFAKYANEYGGADTALVARWSFTGNFDGQEMTAGMDLPIWDHTYTENIYEKDGTDYLIAPGIQGEFTVDFTYDADVDADLTFNFEKSGNCGAMGDEAAKVPIQYALDDEFTTVYYSLNALENAIIATASTGSESEITGSNGTYVITDTATLKDGGAEENRPVTINQTVYWRWPYDVTDHVYPTLTDDDFLPKNGSTWEDADDTAIGNASATSGALSRDSYVLTLVVKAEQRTPAAHMGAITGNTQVSQVLAAGTLSPAGSTATYQWQVCDTINGVYTPIVGETAASYTLLEGDEGKYIRVVATGTNFTGTITSAPVGPIAAAD